MNIYIGVPTLSRFDLLERLLESIDTQTIQPEDIHIIDNSNGDLQTNRKDLKITRTPNMGVARSWNYLINSLPNDEDVILITNDDNALKPFAIEQILKISQDNPNHNYFGSRSNGFSCFAMRKRGLKEVGKFDETFYPAYFEDNDYHYRMKLQGLDFITTEEEIYELGIRGNGSQTLNSIKTKPEDIQLIQEGYRTNERYYQAKWGGHTQKEIYKTPFNL